MHKLIFAAGMTAACYAQSSTANAQTCPQGQIYRVSMQVCQPKSSENAHWLKQGAAKPAMNQSAAKPAVGDLVLFGAGLPTLLKPSVSKPAAKAPAPKTVAAKARLPRPAVSKPRAPKGALPAIAAVPPARPTSDEPKVADTQHHAEPTPKHAAVAAPVSAPPEVVAEAPVERPIEPAKKPALIVAGPRSEAEPTPEHVAHASPEQAAAAPEASNVARAADERAPVPPVTPQQAVDAPVQADAAPPASTEPPVQTSAVEPSKQVRTIPLYDRPEPSPSDAPRSDMPDWGDEKKLVEALRADWKAAPVTRTFQRGDEVPADIPLQPMPAPFAGRTGGVNMHYLMSNGDAVLVLPAMRVVVDIFHISTASLR